MAKTAPKSASTQKFIEIVDIKEDIVLLKGGAACIVVEVQATNFALLSPEEQDAMIYAYAALLNSLSFQMEIVIRSKRLNVANYLKLLDEEKASATNPSLGEQIGLYRDFVAELVKVNSILDKKFYIIIPYTSLEKGLMGAKEQVGTGSSQDFFLIGAKAALHSKSESLLTQLRRLNLKAEVLGKERLVRLFYEIFNDVNLSFEETENVTKPQREQEQKEANS